MTDVDPFLIPVPRKILDDPQLRPFFEYFVKWAHDIWQRTGGGSDAVGSVSVRNSFVWDSSLGFESTQDKMQSISASSNYTGLSNEYIKASSSITVTFPLYPKEGDMFGIKNNDGTTISYDGNGRNVNGSSTGSIKYQNTSLMFYYSLPDNSWEIV